LRCFQLAKSRLFRSRCTIRGGKHRAERFAHALQSIGHRDQDVVTSPGLQVRENFHPELRAFGLLDPDPEDVARPIGQHRERQVNRLASDDGFITNLDAERVEEHDRIHGLERARLPGGDLGHDRVRHRADQIGRDVDAVHVREKRLNLAHREPARIERDDLVIEAREASLMFADQPRLETAVPVARHGERQRAVIRQDGLAAAPIAMIVVSSGLVPPGT
jgi:hypothetical protein